MGLVHLTGWETKDLLDRQEWHGDVYDESSHSFGANIAIVGTYIYATADGASNTILDAVPLDFFQRGLTKKQFAAMLKSCYELPSDLMELKLELASDSTSVESRFQVTPLDETSTYKSIDSQFETLHKKYRNRYALLKGEYFGPFDFVLSDENELAPENVRDLSSWSIGQKGIVKRWRIVQIQSPEEMLAVGDGGDAGHQLIHLSGWSTAQLLSDQDWYGDNTDDSKKAYIGANIAIVGTYTYASNTILKAIPLKLFRQGLTKKQFLDMLKVRYDLPPEIMDLKSKLQSNSFSIKSVEDDTAYDSRTDVVTRAFLPDYEQTPIGAAFNAFFAHPKWEFKVAPNGIKYVIFSGRLRTPVQIQSNMEIGGRYLPQTILKETLITFKFVIKPNAYREFEIYSVDVEEDGYGRQVETGQRQIDSLIEAVYALDIIGNAKLLEKDVNSEISRVDDNKDIEQCFWRAKNFYDNSLTDNDRKNLPSDKFVEAVGDYIKQTGRKNLNPNDYLNIAIDAQLIPLARRFYAERFSVDLRRDIPLEEFIFAAKEYRDRSGKILYYMDYFNVKTKVASKNWWWQIKYLYENEALTDDANQPITWEEFADALENYRRAERTSIETISYQNAMNTSSTHGRTVTNNYQRTEGMSIEELMIEIGFRQKEMFKIIKPDIKKYLAKKSDWKAYATGYYEDYLTEDFKKHVSLAEFVGAAEAYKKRTESTSVPHLYITDLAQIRRDIWMKKYQQGVWE